MKSFDVPLSALVIVVCGLIWGAASGHAELVDRVVATVNDEVVTLSELDAAVDPIARRIRQVDYGPDLEREMLFKARQDVLNSLIDQVLADQEIKRLQVTVEESDVDQFIERLKSEYFLTDAELTRSLESEGYSFEEYRKKIKEQVLWTKLVNVEVKSKIAVTEEEIQRYYDEHSDDYKGLKKYHLRTILLKVPGFEMGEQERMAREEMESIIHEFESGAAFDELARKHSQDKSAAQGGDLGLFTLDQLSAEFRQIVSELEPGRAGPIMRTKQGYQIIMLEEIKEIPGKTFTEARREIHERLYQDLVEKKKKEWLKALRERSYVKIVQ